MTDKTPVPPQQSEVAKTTMLKSSLFGGRFTRKQYFWRMLLTSFILDILLRLISIPAMAVSSSIKEINQTAHLLSLPITIPAAIFFYIPFAVKRAHDIGHKGTFLITLSVIALIEQFLGLFSVGLPLVLFLITLIPYFVYGSILLFKDSQKGTNAYGPSIKYPDVTPVPPQQSEVAETTWLEPSLFGGRFTRKQYFWRIVLANFIVFILYYALPVNALVDVIGTWMFGSGNSSTVQIEKMIRLVFLPIPIYAIIFLYLPFGIKRAHDIGHKGTFIITLSVIALIVELLLLVPAVLHLTVYVRELEVLFQGPYYFQVLVMIERIILISALVYTCILLFKDSQKGTNAYGPSIKYPGVNLTETKSSSLVGLNQWLFKSTLGKCLFASVLVCAIPIACQITLKLCENYTAERTDVNETDEHGETPLHWYARDGYTEIAKLLIEKGADVNKAGYNGYTPLHVTAWEGHTETVKMLIEKGADVNKTDKDGRTPLHGAAGLGHTETVKMLIEKGADVNKADKDGETPLYRAAWEGHTETVKLLIEKGADVNKADRYGETPLYWAAREGHTEIVELLQQAGAKE